MDDLDHRLIAALRVDGRASLSELAKALGVSRGTIQNRLDRLIAAEVILGFTVRVGNSPAEKRIRAIAMIEVSGMTTGRVAKSLRGLPQIHALHSTNGAFDLIAEIEVENLVEFDRVLSAIRSIDGIAKSETSLLLAPA
ncbi:MAG: Lrp/AsnC family transcriptional regulator [Methylocystis sp.]